MNKVTGTTLVLMGSGLLILALILDGLSPTSQGILLVASMVMNIWGVIRVIKERKRQ